MVRERMGLLDDAIREHLELKRLKGADPGVVAREEHDALGLTAGQDPETSEEAREAPGEDYFEAHAESQSGLAALSPHPGQETVELDMDSVLDQDSEPAGHVGLADEPDHRPGRSPDPMESEDSLEWEMPGDETTDEPQPKGDDREQVEDVLEETPDFLRETPEQDRLWFEQRPPRDFDFNE
jgi:hypothetical protein